MCHKPMSPMALNRDAQSSRMTKVGFVDQNQRASHHIRDLQAELKPHLQKTQSRAVNDFVNASVEISTGLSPRP